MLYGQILKPLIDNKKCKENGFYIAAQYVMICVCNLS